VASAQRLAKSDREFTDWNALACFVDKFLKAGASFKSRWIGLNNEMHSAVSQEALPFMRFTMIR
jgi:hypothetical protein